MLLTIFVHIAFWGLMGGLIFAIVGFWINYKLNSVTLESMIFGSVFVAGFSGLALICLSFYKYVFL